MTLTRVTLRDTDDLLSKSTVTVVREEGHWQAIRRRFRRHHCYVRRRCTTSTGASAAYALIALSQYSGLCRPRGLPWPEAAQEGKGGLYDKYMHVNDWLMCT